MKQAINAYVDLGRFHIAAKHEKEIAEVHDGYAEKNFNAHVIDVPSMPQQRQPPRGHRVVCTGSRVV